MDLEEKIKEVANLLVEIPPEAWRKIVEEEPEWRFMNELLPKYGFGKFAVLMMAAGLNDFQLKGRAEEVYWPVLREILVKHPVPETLEELQRILEEFYKNERLKNMKLNRLRRFMSSQLAKRVFSSSPEEISKEFPALWLELGKTMKQSPEKKTISFAMKCLGLSLMMLKKYDFEFERVPIPVDLRVRTLTQRLGISGDDSTVRFFWKSVLEALKERNPEITMIHLDSLVWQIGTADEKEIIDYFSDLECPEIGKKLVKMLKG